MLHEELDPKTGVTTMSTVTPLILYRDNPSQAAYARNYVNLGPIETNTMGSFRYYLWAGIWNTMQTADSEAVRAGFDSITLVADGEPLTLELAGFTPSAIGLSSPVYTKPVASATDAYYAVTVDQVRLIAESRDLRLRTSGSSQREYLLWGSQQAARTGLDAFVDAAMR